MKNRISACCVLLLFVPCTNKDRLQGDTPLEVTKKDEGMF